MDIIKKKLNEKKIIMMGYNYEWISRDLHYNYTRWLLKSFNNAELYYLRVLRDGIDDTINAGINYVNSNMDTLNNLQSRWDWRDYYNDDGELESILNNIKSANIQRGLEPIYDFYRSGGELASAHMHKELADTEATTVSLQILLQFIGRVVDNINTELNIGLTQFIGQSIEDNNLENFGRDLLDIPYTSGNSKFHLRKDIIQEKGLTSLSTDARCIYAAKTEYARCVNTGLLQQYENYGIDSFDWITSGLPNTCRECLNIESESPYTLDEIMDIGLPHHPNCSCSIKGRLPVNIHLNPNPRVVDLTNSN